MFWALYPNLFWKSSIFGKYFEEEQIKRGTVLRRRNSADFA